MDINVLIEERDKLLNHIKSSGAPEELFTKEIGRLNNLINETQVKIEEYKISFAESKKHLVDSSNSVFDSTNLLVFTWNLKTHLDSFKANVSLLNIYTNDEYKSYSVKADELYTLAEKFVSKGTEESFNELCSSLKTLS